jgi:hypothetical protein
MQDRFTFSSRNNQFVVQAVTVNLVYKMLLTIPGELVRWYVFTPCHAI